jgi:hypothetical protein
MPLACSSRSVDRLEAAGGVTKIGSAALRGFVPDEGVRPALPGKASFVAADGR